jgi:hypothetical protein
LGRIPKSEKIGFIINVGAISTNGAIWHRKKCKNNAKNPLTKGFTYCQGV